MKIEPKHFLKQKCFTYYYLWITFFLLFTGTNMYGHFNLFLCSNAVSQLLAVRTIRQMTSTFIAFLGWYSRTQDMKGR